MIRSVLTLTIALVFVAALALSSPVSSVTSARDQQLKSSPVVTAPASCGSVCLQNFNSCKLACGGNSACIAQCQSEYDCCLIQCHGGSCRVASVKQNK
jgi:hypothetical protein